MSLIEQSGFPVLSVKINTHPEDTQKWIESFSEKMIEIYDLEERPVQHGYQFALYKNGSKYVSATTVYYYLGVG
jgi:hypothetical protein